MHFSWFPVEAALASFNLGFLLKKIWGRINHNKRDCYQRRNTNFLTMYILKGPLASPADNVTTFSPHYFACHLPGSWLPEGKRPGFEYDHSPPSSTEASNKWSHTFIAQVFMAYIRTFLTFWRRDYIFNFSTLCI